MNINANYFLILIFLSSLNAKDYLYKSLQTLHKYKDLLEEGTYVGSDWSSFKHIPKSRYYTFKKAFEHFEKMNGKTIVELGTNT